MRERGGGEALPADLDRERLVACRHEPQGNERTRRERDQHDAGQEHSPAALAGVQADFPWGCSRKADFTPEHVKKVQPSDRFVTDQRLTA